MPRTATRRTTTRRTPRNLSFTVKVGRVGDEVREFAFDEKVTVDEVLEKAGLDYGEGQRLRFKGEPVDPSTELSSDGTLIISGQIKGGSK